MADCFMDEETAWVRHAELKAAGPCIRQSPRASVGQWLSFRSDPVVSTA